MERPVDVLVAAPLPRAGLLAEVHRHAQRRGDLGVRYHLLALIPGQRPAQLRRETRERGDERTAELSRTNGQLIRNQEEHVHLMFKFGGASVLDSR